ncbi:uncharacterized protein LOC142227024 [Haematobia irritans]|uniref:uncharacterized protein LOC142227024 n=1 Tax=Haematobia irritans TaxID=7368 RepID=UPI003F4F452B
MDPSSVSLFKPFVTHTSDKTKWPYLKGQLLHFNHHVTLVTINGEVCEIMETFRPRGYENVQVRLSLAKLHNYLALKIKFNFINPRAIPFQWKCVILNNQDDVVYEAHKEPISALATTNTTHTYPHFFPLNVFENNHKSSEIVKTWRVSCIVCLVLEETIDPDINAEIHVLNGPRKSLPSTHTQETSSEIFKNSKEIEETSFAKFSEEVHAWSSSKINDCKSIQNNSEETKTEEQNVSQNKDSPKELNNSFVMLNEDDPNNIDSFILLNNDDKTIASLASGETESNELNKQSKPEDTTKQLISFPLLSKSQSDLCSIRKFPTNVEKSITIDQIMDSEIHTSGNTEGNSTSPNGSKQLSNNESQNVSLESANTSMALFSQQSNRSLNSIYEVHNVIKNMKSIAYEQRELLTKLLAQMQPAEENVANDEHQTEDKQATDKVTQLDVDVTILLKKTELISSTNQKGLNFNQLTSVLQDIDQIKSPIQGMLDNLNNLTTIHESLMLENFTIYTLIFADAQNIIPLKTRAMKMIKSNIEKYVQTNEWLELVESCPNLIVDILRN